MSTDAALRRSEVTERAAPEVQCSPGTTGYWRVWSITEQDIEGWVMSPTVERSIRVCQPRYADRTSTPRSWNADVARVFVELSELSDGWFGEGSLAPNVGVLNQMSFIAGGLAETREPQIEVDPSDGEVSFIWGSKETGSSVALTFTGSKDVVIVETNMQNPIGSPVSRFEFNGKEDAANVARKLWDSSLSGLMKTHAHLR